MLIVNQTRVQLLSFLPKGGTVAEIGVFRGFYSRAIFKTVRPDLLHLIDPWVPESASSRGEAPLILGAYEEVRSVFQTEIQAGRVILHRDYSTSVAPSFPDGLFDWIYVDGMHDAESVRADLMAFRSKVKIDGFILGHDFSNSERSRRRSVGVVHAVREFTAIHGFELVLLTNEEYPTFLLARADNRTTLPDLLRSLVTSESRPPIEIGVELLGRFEQVEVESAIGKSTQIIRFG